MGDMAGTGEDVSVKEEGQPKQQSPWRTSQGYISPSEWHWFRRRFIKPLVWLIVLSILAALAYAVVGAEILSLVVASRNYLVTKPDAALAVISVASLLVAMLAIFVTVAEIRANRRFHYLAALPRIEVFIEYNPGRALVLSLANEGIGSAIITDLYVDTGSSLHPHFAGWFRYMLATENPKGLNIDGLFLDEPACPTFIHPKEKWSLIGYSPTPPGEEAAVTTKAMMDFLIKHMKSVTFYVKYRDIYDHRFNVVAKLGDNLTSMEFRKGHAEMVRKRFGKKSSNRK
jgi:hypothetical protein